MHNSVPLGLLPMTLLNYSNLSTLQKNLNKEINKLSDWCKANKFTLNPIKSNELARVSAEKFPGRGNGKKRPENSAIKPLSTIFVLYMKIQEGHGPPAPAADAHVCW